MFKKIQTHMSHTVTHKFRLDISRPVLNALAVIPVLMLIVLATIPFTKSAHAFGPGGGGIIPKSGYVTTRGLVLDEATGKPIYAEIMPDGQYGTTYGPAVDNMADAYVISADQYRAIVGLFDAISARPDAQGAYVLTRERYQNIQRIPGHFGMIDVPVLGSETPESVPVPAPDIDATTKSVLIRANATIDDPRALPRDTGPILLEAPINISATAIRRDLSADTTSVLLSKNGDVLQISNYDIGFKSRFIKRLSNDNPDVAENTENFIRFRPGDRAAGPVAFAYVDAGLGYTYSPAYTDENGLFRLNLYIPSCPGFFWSHDFNLWARLNYRSFDPEAPNGNQPRHYYFTRPYSETCNGLGAFPPSLTLGGMMAMINVRSIIATQATPMIRADFLIDVVMLNGKGALQNPGAGTISVTDGDIEYTYAAPAFTPGSAQNVGIQLDLDQDNQEDWQILNPDDPRLVNVYLGGNTHTDVDADGNPVDPDLQRVADTAQDFGDQGLLASINKDALKDTDLYVYRVATGQLVTKTEGLDTRQIIQSETGFSYKIIIPGPVATRTDFSTRRFRAGYLGDWQESLGLPEDMRGRQADALRPGETVQIIAINRATGYIGSADAIIQQAGSGTNPGRLDFDIPNIVLRPPNLKIQAKRTYRIAAGLTRGESANYQIGFEGSALASDTIIELSTEWFDHKGNSLPEDLEGYTGQLAKIVGPNVLGGSGVADFPINPGKHLQVVQLQGDILGPEHFYVHVFGKPAWRNLGPGAGTQGPLEYRPKNYVPVKVPLYDEATTQRLRNIAVAEGRPISEVEPIYRWAYRPEMQFSVFDLAMRKINRTDADGNVVDIYPAGTDTNPATIPGFAGGDQLAQLLYNLTTNPNAPLTPLGPDRQLIFALGEEEVIATMGENQTLQFDNLDHLSQLSVEDFLSIRLYQNSDSANILWEFAFEYLAIVAPEDKINRYEDTIYLSADDPVLDLAGVLIGYADRDESLKEMRTVRWSVEGDGVFGPRVISNDDSGIFNTTLRMPHIAGSTAIPVAELMSEPSTKAKYNKIEVIPGEPAVISMTPSGVAYAQGVGELLVTATVRDVWGNLVIDGTSATFNVSGNGSLKTFEGTTIDGQVTATIIGSYASGGGTLGLRVADINQDHLFNIEPVSVVLNNVPTNALPNSRHTITGTVTAGGGVAPNVFIDLGYNGGLIGQSEYKSDALGQIEFIMHVGDKQGTTKLTARADITNQVSHTITVADQQPRTTVKNRDFMVSDPSGAAASNYIGLGGLTKSVGYNGDMLLTLNGAAQASWQIELNDPHYPNHEPLLLYRFQRTNYDDTNIHNGVTVNVTRDRDDPAGPGFSGVFQTTTTPTTTSSKLTINHDAVLAPAQPAIATWLKVKTSGQILNWGNDTIQLIAQPDNSLRLLVVTNNGTKQLDSAPVTWDQWTRLAIGMTGSEIYLAVDDNRYALALAGETVAFPPAPINDSPQWKQWITLGDGFEGKLNLFRLYDLTSAELITFASANGGAYDAQGQASLQLASTNALGSLQASSRLQNATVGLRLNGASATTINIVHSQQFVRYAGLLSDVFNDGDIDQQAFENSIQVQGMFPGNNVVSEKILELASDTDIGNSLNVVLASLGSLQFRDDIAALLPHVRTIQEFYNQNNQPLIMMATADLLGEAVKRALRGDEYLLNIMQTSLVVLAETIVESTAVAQAISNAIVSKDDLWIWMRFMSMPANGWLGPIIPIPEPDSECIAQTPDLFADTPFEFTKKPCRVKGTVIAAMVNDWITEDATVAADPKQITSDMRALIETLREAPIEITRLAFSTIGPEQVGSNSFFIKDAHAIAPILVKSGLQVALKIMKKKGVNNLKNFIHNGTNSRVKPLTLLAAMGYLESRKPGCTDCKPLSPQVYGAVQTNITTWITGLAMAKSGEIEEPEISGKACFLNFRSHGAALEIVLTAMYHGLYEFAPDSEKFEIIAADDQERLIKMKLFHENEGEIEQYLKGLNFGRRPDLILAGDGVGQRIWVEGKSWLYNSDRYGTSRLNTKVFKKYDPVKEGKHSHIENAHRQFFQDRIASAGTLNTEFWNVSGAGALLPAVKALRPTSHKTWIQVWDWEGSDNKRTYYEYKKGAPPRRIRTINPHTAWMTTNQAQSGALTSHFKNLQGYFTELPKTTSGVFKATLGMADPVTNNEAYTRGQKGQKKDIAPFYLPDAILQVANQSAKDLVMKKIQDELLPEEYKQWLNGDISEESLAEIRMRLILETERILGSAGTVLREMRELKDKSPDWVKWTLQKIDDAEESMADYVDGWAGEELMEYIGSIDTTREGESCDI